jgi:hypothetical protein
MLIVLCKFFIVLRSEYLLMSYEGLFFMGASLSERNLSVTSWTFVILDGRDFGYYLAHLDFMYKV